MPLFGRMLLTMTALTGPTSALTRYEPRWESLDGRPLPRWYDGAKLGVFLHWGLFSVPSFGSEWFWARWRDPLDPQHARFQHFMDANYRPGFTYADFAGAFTAELFQAEHWADVLERSGARYVVLTSKHHEGFCLWPSAHSWSWNSLDVGPKRDLVADLAAAVRNRTRLKFGVYHSLFEWYNPLYKHDRRYNDSAFVTEKTLPELYELVTNYEPELIWSDGDWAGAPEYWRSKEFLAWLYNDSPVKDTVVVNDRWGSGTNCRHGGYYTCHDGFNPGVLQDHKFENCFSIDGSSWGYNRAARLSEYFSIEQLLYQLASTVSCGGNMLVNIGPTKDGTIDPLLEERLLQLGRWLHTNGEAIYSSTPWRTQRDQLAESVWYTRRQRFVYAIVLRWPHDRRLRLGSAPHQNGVCELLGYEGDLNMRNGVVQMPKLQKVKSEWAWVLRFLVIE